MCVVQSVRQSVSQFDVEAAIARLVRCGEAWLGLVRPDGGEIGRRWSASVEKYADSQSVSSQSPRAPIAALCHPTTVSKDRAPLPSVNTSTEYSRTTIQSNRESMSGIPCRRWHVRLCGSRGREFGNLVSGAHFKTDIISKASKLTVENC